MGMFTAMRQVGRCIPVDYYLGCSVDVLERLEGRCSGRPACQVHVPDTDVFPVQPCRKDLVPYLLASYRCAPGTLVIVCR